MKEFKNSSNGVAYHNGTDNNNDIEAVDMELDSDDVEKRLVFLDNEHHRDVLSSLNLLQKGGQFCDVKLVVDKNVISAHRAVLAAASTYLFNLFTTSKESVNMFELTDIDYQSFQHLLNYAYTGQLELPGAEVKTVYKAAMQLRIASAAKACSDFLVANLSPSNCLEIRYCAKDGDLKFQVDTFIQTNIAEVISNSKVSSLPRILIEIVGPDDAVLGNKVDEHIFHLVFNWVKSFLNEDRRTFSHLTEQTHVLYLDNDHSLQDCRYLDDSSLDEDDMIKDYKMLSKKKQLTISKNKCDTNGHSPNQLRKFASSDCEWIQHEEEWSLMACHQTADRTSVGVVLLNGTLAIITLHLRPCQPHSPSSTVSDPESPTNTPSSNGSRPSSMERNLCLTLLAQMSTARCGFGLAVLNKKLVAVGGYDRGECLRSAEMFDVQNNVWTSLAPMKIARGRLAVAVLNNKLYAVGGSDGHHELRSVECYDPDTNKWSFVADMKLERSCPGVVALNNHIYCVGGCAGQRCISECEVYDPSTDKWEIITPLNEGHLQAAVCAYNGKIFAIGGSSSWNCLSSVKVYDPNTNIWQNYSSLNTPRRGAGADIIDGKIMVVGGNDGTHSLKSTEIYDIDNDCWYVGPQLGIERANVSVASIGNKLFAIGGFSGKKFLDSLEYLNSVTDEWCCYSPIDDLWQLYAANGNNMINEVTDSSKKARKSHSKSPNTDLHLNDSTNGELTPIQNTTGLF